MQQKGILFLSLALMGSRMALASAWGCLDNLQTSHNGLASNPEFLMGRWGYDVGKDSGTESARFALVVAITVENTSVDVSTPPVQYAGLRVDRIDGLKNRSVEDAVIHFYYGSNDASVAIRFSDFRFIRVNEAGDIVKLSPQVDATYWERPVLTAKFAQAVHRRLVPMKETDWVGDRTVIERMGDGDPATSLLVSELLQEGGRPVLKRLEAQFFGLRGGALFAYYNLVVNGGGKFLELSAHESVDLTRLNAAISELEIPKVRKR